MDNFWWLWIISENVEQQNFSDVWENLRETSQNSQNVLWKFSRSFYETSDNSRLLRRSFRNVCEFQSLSRNLDVENFRKDQSTWENFRVFQENPKIMSERWKTSRNTWESFRELRGEKWISENRRISEGFRTPSGNFKRTSVNFRVFWTDFC